MPVSKDPLSHKRELATNALTAKSSEDVRSWLKALDEKIWELLREEMKSFCKYSMNYGFDEDTRGLVDILLYALLYGTHKVSFDSGSSRRSGYHGSGDNYKIEKVDGEGFKATGDTLAEARTRWLLDRVDPDWFAALEQFDRTE